MLPASTLIIPPVLVAAITGWLAENGWPKWANAIISLLVIGLVAWIWSLFSGQLVGHDIWTNIAFVAGVCAALVAGPLQPFQQWITARFASPLKLAVALFWSPQLVSATTQPMHRPVPPRSSSPYMQEASIQLRRHAFADPYVDEDKDEEQHATAVIPVVVASASEPADPDDLPPSA